MISDNPDSRKKEPRPVQLKVTEASGLLKFLLTHLHGKGRNTVKSILSHHQVLVDGRVETHFDFQLKPQQLVTIRQERIAEEIKYRGLKILFEDSYVIVIEKDAGLLSMASEKEKVLTAYSILSGHVKRENPNNRIFIVHRLDRDTSGVMMFAKSEKMQTILQQSWYESVSERTYIAVVEGEVENNEGTIRSYLKENKALIMYSTRNKEDGDEAITHYKVLKRAKGFSLLEIELETGRKNQIRVHLKELGHSVIGDEKYGSKQNPIGRVGLHAKVLAFKHPFSGTVVRFESPVPQKLLKLFE